MKNEGNDMRRLAQTFIECMMWPPDQDDCFDCEGLNTCVAIRDLLYEFMHRHDEDPHA